MTFVNNFFKMFFSCMVIAGVPGLLFFAEFVLLGENQVAVNLLLLSMIIGVIVGIASGLGFGLTEYFNKSK